MVDSYHCGVVEGARFHKKSSRDKPGGASNVTANCEALLGVKFHVDQILRVEDLNPGKRPWTMNYFVDENMKVVFEHPEQMMLEAGSYYWREQLRWLTQLQEITSRVIILSDYDKGALNGDLPLRFERGIRCDVVVVDSRYRSINPKILKSISGLKIWHATGDELDLEWGQEMGFDHIVHTNGPDAVVLYESLLRYKPLTPARKGWDARFRLDVPDTEVVNACGAGDTMVAAIASWYMVNDRAPYNDRLNEAVRFGIDCCQNVIRTPFTSVAYLTIPNA